MFFWNYYVFPKLWITSRFGCVFHITQFARNVDLILTILLKHSFSWTPFPRRLICKNLNVNLNFVREFKFAKLEIFLKIKLDSDSIWIYEKLKLWHSYEIYLTVHNANHELDFYDRISNENKWRIIFNVICNSFWDISSENFVNHIFVKITLNKNTLRSSFQNFSSCKNSSFCRV